jgi:hypothetical protein
MPTIVMTLPTITMRRRPMRFIQKATGTASSRNHRKTIEGMSPARLSESAKCCCT